MINTTPPCYNIRTSKKSKRNQNRYRGTSLPRGTFQKMKVKTVTNKDISIITYIYRSTA